MSTTTETSDRKDGSTRNWVVLSLALVASISGLYIFILLNYFCTWQERGVFGDAWGGLNSLFSGLGLFGVAVALALQKRELAGQERELAAAREEQMRTSEILKKQVEALALNAAAQTTLLALYAKHQGFGSGHLQKQVGQLERLASAALDRLIGTDMTEVP